MMIHEKRAMARNGIKNTYVQQAFCICWGTVSAIVATKAYDSTQHYIVVIVLMSSAAILHISSYIIFCTSGNERLFWKRELVRMSGGYHDN